MPFLRGGHQGQGDQVQALRIDADPGGDGTTCRRAGKTAEYLRNRTGGVYIHFIQVLDALAESGILSETESGGRWRLARPVLNLPVPESLQAGNDPGSEGRA